MFDISNEESKSSGWVALTPGLDIPAKLVSVEKLVKKDGEITDNLVFKFEGTSQDNVGNFDHIVWKSSFDPEAEYFTPDNAKKTLVQTKHIITAFIDEEKVEVLNKATGWDDYSESVLEIMKMENIADPNCHLKVILNNKDANVFPRAAKNAEDKFFVKPFIRSAKTPRRKFTVNTGINANTGLPYERFEKMEAPASNESSSFGGGDDTSFTEGPKPAFG